MRFFDLAGETEWTCEKVLPVGAVCGMCALCVLCVLVDEGCIAYVPGGYGGRGGASYSTWVGAHAGRRRLAGCVIVPGGRGGDR
jgi:hypothetical protein